MAKSVGAVFLVLAFAFSSDAAAGDVTAGDERYHMSCHACHGAAGKGASSYPRVSGNTVEYTREKLIAYRSGQKFGPNSPLMIMMAKPLSDEEIEDLAVYLRDAEYKP
jgi:cytochrome c553